MCFQVVFKKRKKQEYPEENLLMYKRSFKTRTIIFPISAHVVSIPFAKEVLMTLHVYRLTEYSWLFYSWNFFLNGARSHWLNFSLASKMLKIASESFFHALLLFFGLFLKIYRSFSAPATNLIYPINEVCQVSSHPKTVLFVKLPAIGTFPIFVVRVFGVLSTVTLAVVLNSEIFIAFVLGHSSTLVNSQVHVLPHDLISEVCVMIGKSSIEIIPKTTNWLRIWHRFCEKKNVTTEIRSFVSICELGGVGAKSNRRCLFWKAEFLIRFSLRRSNENH